MADHLLLKSIFTSSARIDLISFFFQHIDEEIYMSMLKYELGKNLSTYQKELDNLSKIGFLKEKRTGNLRIFLLNTSFVFYKELKGIFNKTSTPSSRLKFALSDNKHIEYAFIYNRFPDAEKRSKVLFVVIKDTLTNFKTLHKRLTTIKTESHEDYEILIYPKSEIRDRLLKNDPEITYAVNCTKTMLVEAL